MKTATNDLGFVGISINSEHIVRYLSSFMCTIHNR